MMNAILDANDPVNLQACIAYVDDLNEIHADVNTSKIVPKLSNSFLFKATHTATIGLSFASEKSEVIHFSMATRKKSRFLEHLTLNDKTLPCRIDPSHQIKSLGVIVDSLNFIVHAQYASSKGMQALGSLLYLRKGLNGISSYTARYLAISKIMPKIPWAPPIWWMGSQSILHSLEIGYNRTRQWITGLLE
jgi:hypothetical protein